MGVKRLNTFITRTCKSAQSISKINVANFRDKTIAVDASIYLYKFSIYNELIERFYEMITMFHRYNIRGIFVFDGKPTLEKWATIDERQKQKKVAADKYAEYQSCFATLDRSTTEYANTLKCMNRAKKQMVRIRYNDIERVKVLLTAYGMEIYNAPEEADRICASLVLGGLAWGCMSDDMDMLVYGVPRLYRHVSLSQETVLLYDRDSILTDLDMTMDELRQLAVTAGTDYNVAADGYSIEELFREKTANRWIFKGTKYICDDDLDEWLRIYKMFYIDEVELAEFSRQFTERENAKKIDQEWLHRILVEDGFIFLS